MPYQSKSRRRVWIVLWPREGLRSAEVVAVSSREKAQKASRDRYPMASITFGPLEVL